MRPARTFLIVFSEHLRALDPTHQEHPTSRSSSSAWKKLQPLFHGLALQLASSEGTCRDLEICAWWVR
jgi:hypothetical protein